MDLAFTSLLILFTAQPGIAVSDLYSQLSGPLHNLFPLLTGDIVGNFRSVASVGHHENFYFLWHIKGSHFASDHTIP